MGEKLLISHQIYVGSRRCKQTAMHITGQLQSWQLVPSRVKKLLKGAKLFGTDQQTSYNGRKNTQLAKKIKQCAKGKQESCLFSNKKGSVLIM